MADQAELDVVIKAKAEALDALKDVRDALKDIQAQARETNVTLKEVKSGLEGVQDAANKTNTSLERLVLETVVMRLGLDAMLQTMVDTRNEARELNSTLKDVRDTLGDISSQAVRTNVILSTMAAAMATMALAIGALNQVTATATTTQDTAATATRGWFQSMVTGIPIIGNFLGSLVAIGPVGIIAASALALLVVAVIAIALTFIGAVVVVTAAVATMVAVTVAGFAAMGAAVALALGPIGLLIGGVILLGDRMFTSGKTAVDPLLKLEEAIGKVADTWGTRALPMTIQMTNWALTLLPQVQALGNSLLDWFGPRLGGIMDLATQAMNRFFVGLGQIGDVLGPFIDSMIKRLPDITPIAEQAFGGFLAALKGLFDNLIKFVDWFIKEWPTIGPTVKQIMDQVGQAIQSMARTAKDVVEWFVAHWPEIQKTSENLVGPMHAVGATIQFIAEMMVGLMRGYNDFVIALDRIGGAFSNIGDKAQRVLDLMLLIGQFGLINGLSIAFPGKSFGPVGTGGIIQDSPGAGTGSFLTFAEGGSVPGPRGAATLAVVHGGEVVLSNDRQDDIVRLLASIDRKLSSPTFSKQAYSPA